MPAISKFFCSNPATTSATARRLAPALGPVAPPSHRRPLNFSAKAMSFGNFIHSGTPNKRTEHGRGSS